MKADGFEDKVVNSRLQYLNEKAITMLLDIIFLLVGLAMIIYGADFLTNGASTVAKRFGLSDLVVGLTIVAFGTSAPEFAISVISAVQGSPGLAIGNVVGSNIANTLLIVGVVAMVSPIAIQKSIMVNEIPLTILAAVALAAIYSSPWLGGGESVISRADGILLLLFFMIFMRYVFAQAKKEEETTETQGKGNPAKPQAIWKSIALIAVGLTGLVWGGDIFVDKASSIAGSLGVSDTIVGLTIVALGTSLPELATSVIAAAKGNPGIALGNVIGSNIFNIFMVLGCAAVVRPLPFAGVTPADMITLVGSALLFWLCGWKFGTRTITRPEGAVMTLCYVGYITYLVITAA